MPKFMFQLSVCLLIIISNFLENMKQGFERTISWKKYRFEIIAQPKNNILDCLIDPTFRILIYH